MLLASAYHPSFRLEKLGGKYYADGGFVDTLPLHVLVEHGYKDIIAVRIPGHGVERRFRMPEDVNVTLISTNSDLGGVLNEQKWPTFDPAMCVDDMVELVVQINGKVRSRLQVPVDSAQADVLAQAKADPKIQEALQGKNIVKEIYVQNKLVNFVAK